MSALQKIRKWRTSPQAGDVVEKPWKDGIATRNVVETGAYIRFEEKNGVVGKIGRSTWSVWCVGATLVNSADELHLNSRANKPVRAPRKRTPKLSPPAAA
jgi:hypothetical protein